MASVCAAYVNKFYPHTLAGERTQGEKPRISSCVSAPSMHAFQVDDKQQGRSM